jgi:RNA polymerase sigma factor (sigma-70 family)
VLALNDALEKLERKHPLQAQVVKLRYFAGMNNEEIAELIGVSLSSVCRKKTQVLLAFWFPNFA